jgi:uncharacterized protein (DUF4415 family)
MSKLKYPSGDLPAISPERQAQLQALAQQDDEGIDYSDIAPLDDTFWASAEPNPFYKPVKTPTSVRLDADVLVWLKSQGKGYQTRINTILREAMLRSRHHKA